MTDEYVQQFVLALRMRDVPGERIGQLVAEVEAHVAESGEAPAEAFGPAKEYADRVLAALDRPSATQRRQTAYAILVGWPIALAAMLVTDGVAGLAFDSRIDLTPGKLALFGLLPPVAVLVIQLTGRQDRWPAVIGVVILCAGVFAVPLLLPRPVLVTYPAWVALATGAILAAGTIPWAARRDQIIDPRDGRNRYPLPRRVILLMASGIALPLLLLGAAAVFLPHGG